MTFDSSTSFHPFVLFLIITHSKFDTFFASFLYISLSVWFSSLPHYCYYIHIGHPQVYGSQDFLYMLHFINKGMGFDHWVFGSSFYFFHFYYSITLAYVSSHVLRLLRGHRIKCHLRRPLLGQVFEIWLIFRCHHASFYGRHLFDVWIWFSCGYGWLGLIHLIMDDLMSFDFRIYRTIWCHTRAYSVLVEIYRFSLIHIIIPNYDMHVELMVYFLLFYHDSPMKPLLSHSIGRLTFIFPWRSIFEPMMEKLSYIDS